MAEPTKTEILAEIERVKDAVMAEVQETVQGQVMGLQRTETLLSQTTVFTQNLISNSLPEGLSARMVNPHFENGGRTIAFDGFTVIGLPIEEIHISPDLIT